jgi:hypothetical protein
MAHKLKMLDHFWFNPFWLRILTAKKKFVDMSCALWNPKHVAI